MATIAELKELAIHSVKGTAPANFSTENVDEALRCEMGKLAGSINQFMKNRYEIYEIIIAAADEYVPTQVKDALAPFAEIQTVNFGQKAIFRKPVGKTRARQFVTAVGLSGLYETFRLDHSQIELSGHAIGGAVAIDFQRFLDGVENLPELMAIVTEGMTDAIYVEIQKMLRAAINASGRPAANKISKNSFVAADMLKMVNVVKAYGGGSAVIFAPPEFVAAMGPDAIVAPISGVAQGIYHPDDIDSIHRTGFITSFRGTPIVQIKQSFVDENENVSTWIDPQIAYILPSGGEKVVKIVLEGGTQIYDLKNPDNSMEIHTYRMFGSAIMAHNNWAIYQNTGITQTYKEIYPNL